MVLQIILLIVYGLIAWTLGVVAARAYYNIIYLKLLLTHGKAPMIIELGFAVVVFLDGVLLAFAGELFANAILSIGQDTPAIIGSVRFFVVLTAFFGMFYVQLYRDRQNLINKLKDKQFMRQAKKKMQNAGKAKSGGNRPA